MPAAVPRGHSKLPLFRRRAAHQTPNPSCTSKLDAGRSGVGEEVAVVRLRDTEDLHHAGQQSIGAGAHVDGMNRQPDGVDPDHRSSSRIQAAHSSAPAQGQLTLIAVAPRRSSMRMSAGAGTLGANVSATNDVDATPLLIAADEAPLRRSAATTQRRARFALMPAPPPPSTHPPARRPRQLAP